MKVSQTASRMRNSAGESQPATRSWVLLVSGDGVVVIRLLQRFGSPGSEQIPGCHKVWLLHLVHCLLIKFLVVVRHTGPLLQEWDDCPKEISLVLIKLLPCCSTCS